MTTRCFAWPTVRESSLTTPCTCCLRSRIWPSLLQPLLAGACDKTWSVQLILAWAENDATSRLVSHFFFFFQFSCFFFLVFVCSFVCLFVFLRNESRNSIVMTYNYPGLGSYTYTSSVWNYWARSYDVISRGNQFFQDKKVGHFVRLKHRQISYLCIGHTDVGPMGDWVRKLCEKMLLNTRKRNPG